jgi:ANTAR domain
MSGKRYRTLSRSSPAGDAEAQEPRGQVLAPDGGGAADGGHVTGGLPESAGQDLSAPLADHASFSGAADIPSASFLTAGEEPVVRRTADGWRVGDDELPDLTCAMVLADLIAAELPTAIQPAVPAVPAAAPAAPPATRHRADGRRSRNAEPADHEPLAEDANRLRTTVGQLEHALTARIRIEQAIGVLSERHRIRPRQAFEQLRTAARNRGRRVIDIAGDVVASATNPLLQLPEELSRQRTGPRHARPARHTLRTE